MLIATCILSFAQLPGNFSSLSVSNQNQNKQYGYFNLNSNIYGDWLLNSQDSLIRNINSTEISMSPKGITLGATVLNNYFLYPYIYLSLDPYNGFQYYKHQTVLANTWITDKFYVDSAILASGGGMVYPGVGIASSNGTGWNSSYTSSNKIPYNFLNLDTSLYMSKLFFYADTAKFLQSKAKTTASLSYKVNYSDTSINIATKSNILGYKYSGVRNSISISNKTPVFSATFHDNIFLGNNINTAFPTTSQQNVCIGSGAGNFSVAGNANNNVFIGDLAGNTGTTCNFNTVVGCFSGSNVTSAAQNVIIGYNSGSGFSTAQNNIILGNNLGGNISTGQNNIYIGNYDLPGNLTNKLNIGNTYPIITGDMGNGDSVSIRGLFRISNLSTIATIPLLATADGRIGTASSDLRLKRSITMYPDSGLVKIKAMKVRTFIYKADTLNKRQIGFIAQEMLNIEPRCIYTFPRHFVTISNNDTIKSDTTYYGIRYDLITATLVKALQELSTKNDTLNAILNRHNLH